MWKSNDQVWDGIIEEVYLDIMYLIGQLLREYYQQGVCTSPSKVFYTLI